MTMEEYEKEKVSRFVEVCWIYYIEKVKIQQFLSGLPSFYKDVIQFDEPKTLEKTIQKDKYLYDQNKGR